MKLNLKNFNVRKSAPYISGSYGLPENTERYTIKAQGLIGIDVFKEDKITLIDIEGGQTCEVIAFNSKGKNNQSIIGQKNHGEAKFVKYILTNSSDKKVLLEKLKKKNIDFNKTQSSNFFDETTIEKDKIKFSAKEDGFILFAAPGEDMQVNQQNAPSNIEVLIERKNNNQNKLDSFLPEPLATPVEEFLIKDSTAITYEIKKGDYV